MTKDGGPELTAELVIELGGWHRLFARVMLIVVDGDVALSLVDGNGDGGELEIEAWHRGPTGWEASASSGFGHGSTQGSVWGEGAAQWCIAGYGVPGETTVVRFRGDDHECRANPSGLWGFVRQTADIAGYQPEIVTDPAR